MTPESSGQRLAPEPNAHDSELTIDLDAGTRPAGSISEGTPQIGGRIGEHYRVEGILGSGGMGTVFLARDECLDREVAIKVIHGDKLGREQIRTRFVEEARAMARVRDPNVVAIHAYGEYGGRPYFVMEYMPGENLSMWRSRHPDLDPAQVMPLLEQLCHGVEAIHATGAVHRDIKPSNVLVGESGRVALADFGLARRVEGEHAQAVELIGTPSYLSPEVARAEVIGPELAHRVDVYALGVIAFEFLTGRLPFVTKALPGLLSDHAFTPAPAPTSLRPELPPAVDRVLLAALAKNPAARTPDVATFRAQLVAAMGTLPDRGRRLGILLADDDEAALLGMTDLLREVFPLADITCVADADTALHVATSTLPDVVVTDLHMPHGGGTQLTVALRADERTRETPIIVVTGYGGALDWQRLRTLGADKFLVKPIDLDALATMIRSVTDRP